jgi:MOSC domain-containing protein YiiM
MTKAGVLLAIATKQKTRAPMIEHVALFVGPHGLPGERAHPNGRAVTVLSREAWAAACRTLGETLPWTLRRANLLVEGVDLAGSVGRLLHVGELVLEIGEETEPCRVMDAIHPGLRKALAPDWRGGVTCRVFTPAEIRVGAAVRLAH